MIWLILGVALWVGLGTAAWYVIHSSFMWEFNESIPVILLFLGILGPFGFMNTVGYWSDARKYWRHGRKSQAEVQREALARAGASVGQWATSMFASAAALNRAFLNTSTTVATFAESLEPEPVEEVTVPEAVVGWRWWSLDPLTMMLRGHVSAWPSGTMEATHLLTPFDPRAHKSPQAGCLCGVNALKPEAVAEYLNEPVIGTTSEIVDVFGRVALTGTVDEYEKGYRGENAEILELVVLSEAPLFTVAGEALLSEMEARYGVRPTVQSRESWLAEMEVIHGYGKENQEDSFGAGESTEGTSQGAGQDRLIHTDNPEDCPACEAMYGR
jgi:hypothetical protein